MAGARGRGIHALRRRLPVAAHLGHLSPSATVRRPFMAATPIQPPLQLPGAQSFVERGGEFALMLRKEVVGARDDRETLRLRQIGVPCL